MSCDIFDDAVVSHMDLADTVYALRRMQDEGRLTPL